MTYAVQYTISTLSGAYAQKYSVIFYDAKRFEDLFEERAPGLKGLASEMEHGEFDAFETFQKLMKLLKSIAKDKEKMAEFKDDNMNLLNLCEETMAKDARLIGQTVPNDTPAPAPLFQL